MDDLNIKPLNEKANKLIIMFHGIGSDGQDLLNLVPYIQPKIPDIHFYSPNGIEKFNSVFGYQWFSLENKTLEGLTQELENIYSKIMLLINAKLKELNLQWKDLILMGFSQGAMLALFITLSAIERFTATISFSGIAIPPKKIPEYNSMTPVCLIHGSEDDIVDFNYMDLSLKQLQGLKFPVEKYIISDLGHTIDLNGLNKAIDFILLNKKLF